MHRLSLLLLTVLIACCHGDESVEPTTFTTAMVMPMPSTVAMQTSPGTTAEMTIPTTGPDNGGDEVEQKIIDELTNIEEAPLERARTLPEFRLTEAETKAPSTQTSLPTIVFEKTCTGKKCPPNSHCVVEHGIARCYCNDDFGLDKNGNCIAKSTQIQRTCDQIKCPKHSACKNGVCMCQPGYVMSSKRCIASTNGRDRCTGVQCAKNSRCVNGFCVCKSGFKYSNGKCIDKGTVPSSNKCSGVKCPENAECKRGYCFCKSQYFSFKGQCRRISAEKNPCDDVKCSDNAVCLKGRCQCTQGYSRTVDGKCQKVFFDKCSNVECSKNEVCNDGRCACKPGYVRQKDGTCSKPAQDKCANIKCIHNAECTRGYCYCKSGYTYKDRKCQALNPCASIKCSINSVCINGACVCKKGYMMLKYGGCIAPSPPPTDKCQRIKCPAHAACKSGYCFCKFGYVHKDGNCVAVNRPKVCGNIQCPENSECRVSKCYCKTGYVSSDKKCIKIGSNTCTRLNCGPHGRCVVRNGRSGCEFSNTGSQHGYQSRYTSTSHSCRNKCGEYDYVRGCSCSNACRNSGSCCTDYRSHCGGVQHGYYYFHG